MSNLKNEIIDIEENIDYWEVFQSETDDTRNLILDHLIKKCDVHNENDFTDIQPFDELKENTIYHSNNCGKYLFESERRRKPFKNGKLLYFQFPCKDFKDTSNCLKGDSCQFCHNQSEIKFHPIIYRREMCKSYKCEINRRYCHKSHRAQDLRNYPFNRKNGSNNNLKVGKSIKDFVKKDLKDNQTQNQSIKFMKSNQDKEDMLNKLNFDIKNLLEELDFDQLDEHSEDNKIDEINKVNMEYMKGKLIYFFSLYLFIITLTYFIYLTSKEIEKIPRTLSTNSKNNENDDNINFENYENKRSNSNSSVSNLRNNLLVNNNRGKFFLCFNIKTLDMYSIISINKIHIKIRISKYK